MMPKKKKSAKLAIVGETALVVTAKNRQQTGISGRITDETRNTIRIETKDGVKTLIKDQITIKINDTTFDGTRLAGRAEERIKR